MKQNLLYIPILLLLLSCETEVKFKGEISEPKLVIHTDAVSGQTLTAYVGRSYFFLDKTQNIELYDQSRYSFFDSYVTDYSTYAGIRGALTDAMVEYQVNGGEWNKMTLYRDSAQQELYKYKSDYLPMAGDSIVIRAAHKNYDTAYAVQVMPVEPVFKIANVTSADKQHYTINLDLEPYTGNDADMLAIQVRVYVGYIEGSGTKRYLNSGTFYSNDPLFAHAINLRTNDLVYYPIVNLYVPAQMIKEQRHIAVQTHVNVPKGKYVSNGKNTVYVETTPDDIEFKYAVAFVSSMTEESYKYFASMAAYNGDYNESYYEDMFEELDTELDFDIAELFEEISEVMSDNFGMEEGIQIFNNVEGGYGHFRAITYSSSYMTKLTEE